MSTEQGVCSAITSGMEPSKQSQHPLCFVGCVLLQTIIHDETTVTLQQGISEGHPFEAVCITLELWGTILNE
jgi:hypothetical protein